MPTIFDGDNLIVTLPEPVNGVLNLSWREDVYEAWKDWLLDNNENLKYVKLFDSFGGDELIQGVLDAGAYFIVRNDSGWRFRPFEADHTIYATDSLVPKNSNIPIMIPTLGGYTVLVDAINPITTVVNISEINDIHGQIPREVWYDSAAATNGNGYQQSPYNVLNDAIDDLENNGIYSLVVLGDLTLNRVLRSVNVRGIGDPVIDLNGQNVTGSSFSRIELESTGGYVGAIRAEHCQLRNNMFLNGRFDDCQLLGDLFCVAGATVFVNDSKSGVAGSGRPTISMNAGNTVDLSVRNHSGGLTIKDCDTAGDVCTVEIGRGSLTFDSSNVDGEMVARTSGKFIDNTGVGCTVVQETPAWDLHQIMGLDPDNAATINEDGSITVGGLTISANTTGTTPNRSTTLTRTP